MALSWPNLPRALKAAIARGKRTLAILAGLARPNGRSRVPGLIAERADTLDDGKALHGRE